MPIDDLVTLVPRNQAVAEIADRLAAGDAWVLHAQPAVVDELARRLQDLPGWRAWIDYGAAEVMGTADWHSLLAAVIVLMRQGYQATAVVVVDRSAPVGLLAAVFGPMPADPPEVVALVEPGAEHQQPRPVPRLYADADAAVASDAVAAR